MFFVGLLMPHAMYGAGEMLIWAGLVAEQSIDWYQRGADIFGAVQVSARESNLSLLPAAVNTAYMGGFVAVSVVAFGRGASYWRVLRRFPR